MRARVARDLKAYATSVAKELWATAANGCMATFFRTLKRVSAGKRLAAEGVFNDAGVSPRRVASAMPLQNTTPPS